MGVKAHESTCQLKRRKALKNCSTRQLLKTLREFWRKVFDKLVLFATRNQLPTRTRIITTNRQQEEQMEGGGRAKQRGRLLMTDKNNDGDAGRRAGAT